MMRAVQEEMRAVFSRAHDRDDWYPAYIVAWTITRKKFETREGREWNCWADPKIVPSLSCMESVRRAIKALARDGVLETAQRWYHDRSEHPGQSGLHFRPTEAEYERLSVGESPTLTPEQHTELITDLVGALAPLANTANNRQPVARCRR